jgi:hypothetical protein
MYENPLSLLHRSSQFSASWEPIGFLISWHFLKGVFVELLKFLDGHSDFGEIWIIPFKYRAWGMTQVVDSLPSIGEALGSIPSSAKSK